MRKNQMIQALFFIFKLKKLAKLCADKGQLPADFWPTYSAFANSRGGVILLGVQEKQGRFSVQGVNQPERIITDLFNTVNNPQKVSVNLLSDQDVSILTIEGKKLVTISVPAMRVPPEQALRGGESDCRNRVKRGRI